MTPEEIALSGLVGALSVLALWGGSVLPGSRLAITFCSAFVLDFLYEYTRLRCGLFVYLCVLCISLLLLSGKLLGVLYGLYFGGYVSVRQFWQKHRWAWLFKGLYLNGVTLLLVAVLLTFSPDLCGRIRDIKVWQFLPLIFVLQIGWVCVDLFLSYVTRVFLRVLADRGAKR